jgi:hypothetical protein
MFGILFFSLRTPNLLVMTQKRVGILGLLVALIALLSMWYFEIFNDKKPEQSIFGNQNVVIGGSAGDVSISD